MKLCDSGILLTKSDQYDFLAERIKAMAEFEGTSVSRTIKISLGIKARPKNSNFMDFQEFLGLWSESDLKEFENNTKGSRVVDPEDWQ